MALTETISASRVNTNGLMQPDTLRRAYEDDANARNVLNTLTWQTYWLSDSDNINLSGYEATYKGTTGILGVIERNIASDFEGGKKPGVGAHLDRVFTGIDWQRKRIASFQEDGKTGERPPFSDLVYLGINPDGLETVRGDILNDVTEGYHEGRNIPPLDVVGIGEIVERRKEFVTSVINSFDSRIPGFVGKYKDLIRQEIIELYANHSISHDISENDARRLLKRFLQTAETKLSEAVKTDENRSVSVPLSYQWINELAIDGLLTPSFDTIASFNHNLIAGEPIDMYCCPNYATEQKGDVHVYTFSELGTGIGLTAERGFPLINAITERSIQLQNTGELSLPVQMNIGVADFEATEDNARLVGLTKEGFEKNLGASVESMVWALTNDTQTTDGREVTIDRMNDPENPIGQWKVVIKQDGKIVTQLSFGPLTGIFVGKVEGYKGRETFDEMVAEKRGQLRAKAETDERFQRRLANLLKLRLGLMTRWRDGSEPYIVQAIGEMFDEMTESGFTAPLLNHKTLPGLTGQLNEILLSATYQHGEKDIILKSKMVKWLDDNASDPEVRAARTFLLKKVAGQGAEYVVMTNLKRQAGGTQIVADSYPMWQVFGDEEEVPVIAVKGGYEGA